MKTMRYFNKGRLSAALVPFLILFTIAMFIAMIKRVEIPIYFPGQRIPVFLTADTFMAPVASGIIAFLLSPALSSQECLSVKKVRMISTAVLFVSTAIACTVNIPLGVLAFVLVQPSSAHYDISILMDALPQLLALSLLPSSIVILLFALFGRKIGVVLSLCYLIFYVFSGTIPLLSFISPIGGSPVNMRVAQMIFSIILYAAAHIVWYATAGNAPILRKMNMQN